MRISKPLRWILYILGGLIAGLLLIIILLAIIRIPIDLSRYKGPVESAASLALGRRVVVDDKIVITTSLRPIFSLEGLLTPNIILIDTTKIRICGKGQVDFKKEAIDLKMAPTPKKPEFFSMATPVEVRGNFDDFGVGIQAGGLIGTTVRFIASPVTVPLARLFSKELPADGGGCVRHGYRPRESLGQGACRV